jgi:hypothetical protein
MSETIDFLAAERVFVRIYVVPEKPTNGYCFGGGVPITFTNVDWFEAVVSDGRDDLIAFIKSKKYYHDNSRYLVLGDHPNFTFTIEPTNVVPLVDPTEEKRTR